MLGPREFDPAFFLFRQPRHPVLINEFEFVPDFNTVYCQHDYPAAGG